MDASIKRINKEKLDYIAKLDETGLKNYIAILIKKYYIAYLQEDEQKCFNLWQQLNEIIYLFEDDFENLDGYINQCMVTTANNTIERLLTRESKLHQPFIVDSLANPNGFDGLAKAMDKSRRLYMLDKEDKSNIRYLHSMMKVGATIDDDMMDLINTVYDSINNK